jgi:ferredoxin
MADKTRKVPKNVPGPFYVDADCDECGLCVEIAPDNIDRSDEGWSYVVRQPANDEERSLCEEAQESCPTECIGCDG